MRYRRPRTPLAYVLAALLAGLLPHTPAAAGEGVEDAPPPAFEISGKLELRTRKVEGERVPEWFIRVGSKEYRLSADASQDELRQARRKYVTIRSEGAAPAGRPDLVVSSTIALEIQELAPFEGVVRLVLGPNGKKKQYALATPHGRYKIAAKHARKFKPFVDLNVAATCFRVSDGTHRAVEGVTRVERKLRKGERDPQSGEQALTGSWKGTLTATKVPPGIPGVRVGDYKVSWTSTDGLEKTTGRLMGSYDVGGVRVRKFNRKKRSATIELAYSFGQGSFAATLEGVFAPDWTSFRGSWKSGFIGSGTFVIELSPSATSAK